MKHMEFYKRKYNSFMKKERKRETLEKKLNNLTYNLRILFLVARYRFNVTGNVVFGQKDSVGTGLLKMMLYAVKRDSLHEHCGWRIATYIIDKAWIIFRGGKGSVPVLLPTTNNNSFSSPAFVLVRVTLVWLVF